MSESVLLRKVERLEVQIESTNRGLAATDGRAFDLEARLNYVRHLLNRGLFGRLKWLLTGK